MTKKRLLPAAIYERASLPICPLLFAGSDLTDLCSQRCAHWGLEHEFLSKFAEGMRRSRINVKKSRQNYDC